MKITFECELCKIYVDLPLKQFTKKRDGDGGLFLNNLKCINCQTIYKEIDLGFGK